MPPDEIRRRLEGLKWPEAPPAIDVVSASQPASRPTDATFVPPPIEPAKDTLWTFAEGQWSPVPIWKLFTDNRETAIALGPDVDEHTEFVTELRKQEGSESALQKAIMLARPENRRL